MSFNRISYDGCAYDLQLERSVGPGDYRLAPDSTDSCNECFAYYSPYNANNQASDSRTKKEIGFGSITEIESELTNRKNPLTDCNKYGKNDGYKKFKTNNKKYCNNFLESQDTRFTNPLDNYRGMSITNFHFTPYLHVNPQCYIQPNRQREGTSTRLLTKDCYKQQKQSKWDKGGALPPKPVKVNRKCEFVCKNK